MLKRLYMLEQQNTAFTQCGINLLFIGIDCKNTSTKLTYNHLHQTKWILWRKKYLGQKNHKQRKTTLRDVTWHWYINITSLHCIAWQLFTVSIYSLFFSWTCYGHESRTSCTICSTGPHDDTRVWSCSPSPIRWICPNESWWIECPVDSVWLD